MIKKTLASTLLLGVVVLALASSGGGKNKQKASLNTSFSSSSYSSGFTLKSGPQYTGSLAFTKKTKDFVLHNSIMAYQKGNTIFILPYKYKVATNTKFRSNLEVVDLKFPLHK